MQKLSVASATSSYVSLAWSSRIGGIPPREKQNVLDFINDQLREIGISDVDRQKIARPHVELIGYDLFYSFTNVANGAVEHYVQTLSSNGGKIETSQSTLISEWKKKLIFTDFVPIEPFLRDGQKFSEYMKQQISPSTMEPQTYAKLLKLVDGIGALYDACRNRGGYTDETITFLERYQYPPNGNRALLYDYLMATP